MFPDNQNLIHFIKISNIQSKQQPSDDAASPPHERDGSVVELPVQLLGGLPHQHEALRVRYYLGRVQRLCGLLVKLLMLF